MPNSRRLLLCCSILALFFARTLLHSDPVYAQQCDVSCFCENSIPPDHIDIRNRVKDHLDTEFRRHQDWFVEDFFTDQILPALMLFTEQMSAVAMHQTFIIGSFFDAKHQLETQRTLQELQTQAHKDYQPSEEFCYFGTNVRSLANSESSARYNALMLSRRQMGRHLGQVNVAGASNRDEDKRARWSQFVTHFCDPKDNGFNGNPNSGLDAVCPNGAEDDAMINADIDYTSLIENPRTLSLEPNGNLPFDLDKDRIVTGGEFAAVPGVSVPSSKTELAVFALGNNLYGHNVLTRELRGGKLSSNFVNNQNLYLALRSVAAKRGVAESSFNAIVGMKAAGTTSEAMDGGVRTETWKFLGAIMKELGVPESEIYEMIGNRPSYYAQLELLTKKIYQNPNFYAGLYDKPANIKRKAVALKAIDLMLDRAIYESQLRQEMVSSVLLSARLREPFKEAQRELQ